MRLQMIIAQRITILFCLTALIFFIGPAHGSEKPLIKNIRFESTATATDRIIFELNGPHLPTGKTLPGTNPRVYFDFPDTVPGSKIKNRIPVDGNFVKQIRHAYHKGEHPKTRVVFDLLANKKMDFKQDFDEKSNTLVIILYPAGTEPEAVAAIPPAPEPVAAEEPAKPAESVKTPEKKVQPFKEVAIPAPQNMEVKESVATEPQEAPPSPAKTVPIMGEVQEDQMTAETEPPTAETAEAKIDEVTEAAEPEPKVAEQEATPEKEAAQQQPAVEDKTVKVASIPPTEEIPVNLDVPPKDATTIQPMSEIGEKEKISDVDTAPVLYSLEFDPKSSRGEIISFKLNGFHPPVVFGIEEDIPRIVCFFKNATAGSELRDMIGTNGKYVKSIKIGKYHNPDNIRVILELVPGNNYDLQQIFFKDDKMFMMIINKAGKRVGSQTP